MFLFSPAKGRVLLTDRRGEHFTLFLQWQKKKEREICGHSTRKKNFPCLLTEMVIIEDNLFIFFFSKERGNYLVMSWVERKDSPVGCHVIWFISFENVYFIKYCKMFFGPLEQQQMYIQELYLLVMIMKPPISSTYSNWYAWLPVLLIFIALTEFLLLRQQFSCITPDLQHFHIFLPFFFYLQPVMMCTRLDGCSSSPGCLLVFTLV